MYKSPSGEKDPAVTTVDWYKISIASFEEFEEKMDNFFPLGCEHHM